MKKTLPDLPAPGNRNFALVLSLVTITLSALIIIGNHLWTRSELEAQTRQVAENRLAIWANDYQAALYHRQEVASLIMSELTRLPKLRQLLGTQ